MNINSLFNIKKYIMNNTYNLNKDSRKYFSMYAANAKNYIHQLLNRIRTFSFKKGDLDMILKKTIYYSGILSCLFVLVTFGFVSVGCEKPKPIPNSDEQPANDSVITTDALPGTKWKLIGFVDTQTGDITEATPTCNECYTLTFNTDTTALGYSFLNIIYLHLKPTLKMGVLTKLYEHGIGTFDLLYNTIYFVESYTVENDTLKFFYNNSKNYLLYKLFKEEDHDISFNLRGTKWKLSGFVNVQTGNVIEPMPQCDQCYYLAFDTDSSAYGHSFMNVISLHLTPVLLMGISTMVYDEQNGTVAMFYKAMESVESYTVENDALKIFYNDNQDYLLYKPHKIEINK
jgi:hypothetical protein